MKDKPNIFTIKDTNFFKGIGILLIIIHNYCHSQVGFLLENEATFDLSHVKDFLSYLYSLNFRIIFTAIFAYLGHYGVQIFIVFSAYGLSIQFKKNKTSGYLFALHKLKKIYFLLAFTIIFWVIFNLIIGNTVNPKSVLWESFLLGSTLSNFFWLYKIFSGPYWFFALIIQFYILFPFIYKFLSRFTLKNIWIPFLMTYVLIYAIYYLTLGSSFRVFGIIIGHLPEAFLGIIMAQHQFVRFRKMTVLISLLVFVFSQFYEFLFPLSFLAISILMINVINFIQRFSGVYFTKFIIYVGTISMILFIVNGPLRGLSWFKIENQDLRFIRLLLFLPLLFIMSHVLFLIYKKLTQLLKI